MKITKCELVSSGSSEVICDIECKNKTFKDIKLKSYTKLGCYNHCKYSDDCTSGLTVRFCDCEKNKSKLLRTWNLITVIPMIFLLYFCYFQKGIGFINTVCAEIVAFVLMDIICCFVEKFVPAIYENKFYKKLEKLEEVAKKEQEKQEAIEREVEAKKLREERENNPYYTKIESATKFVGVLKTLVELYDFGSNEKQINLCLQKFEEMLEKLKEDSSGYNRVAYLFEVYLLEFYNTLELYSNYIKAETITEEKEKNLSRAVNEFYRFLSKQKVEAIYDVSDVDSKFKASADNLVDLIKKEMR